MLKGLLYRQTNGLMYRIAVMLKGLTAQCLGIIAYYFNYHCAYYTLDLIIFIISVAVNGVHSFPPFSFMFSVSYSPKDTIDNRGF